MSSFLLMQVVPSPTQVTLQSCTLINLALVSELSSVYSCGTIPPLANSNHYGFLLQLRTHKEWCNRNVARRKVWRYDLADYTGACNLTLIKVCRIGLYCSWELCINIFLMLCSSTEKLSCGWPKHLLMPSKCDLTESRLAWWVIGQFKVIPPW